MTERIPAPRSASRPCRMASSSRRPRPLGSAPGSATTSSTSPRSPIVAGHRLADVLRQPVAQPADGGRSGRPGAKLRAWVREAVVTRAARRAQLSAVRRADARCRSRSPTTSTSTPARSTPPTSARSSGPTPPSCPPAGSTCRSATTAAPARSSSAAPTSYGPAVSAGRATTASPASGRACDSTSSARSASSSGSRRSSATSVAVAGAARPHLRHRAAQRLERPRHPGLGVRAARPVPRQVVRDVDLGLGDADRPLSTTRPCRCPARSPAVLPYLSGDATSVFGLDLELTVSVNGDVVSTTAATRTCTGRRRRCSRT